MIKLRSATLDDSTAIVALNAAVVAVTSPMDGQRFRELFEISVLCEVVEQDGRVIGFVLAMLNGAPYLNGNYQWFSDRLNRFIYVDRIVISEESSGLGLGKKLYDHVAEFGKMKGSLVMAAEMDLVPENPSSLGFHKKNGFMELSRRELDSGKIVSMQIKEL